MNLIRNLSLNLSLLIFITLLISSCRSFSDQQTEVSSLQGIKVISVSDLGISSLSDVVDKISHTTLKEHPQHRAYRIDKVLIQDELVYIFDYFPGRSLSVYDLDGNFQFDITQLGEGPGQ
jgi:hypothetical protein